MKNFRKILLTLTLALPMFVASCDNGGQQQGEKHVHSFDREVANSEFLASAATCHEQARYYYSCECGEHGTATFKYGSLADHTFESNYSYNQYQHWKNSTCGHAVKSGLENHVLDQKIATEEFRANEFGGTQQFYLSCKCGFHGTATFELSHEFNEDDWAYDETGHWHACRGCSDEKKDFAEHDMQFVEYASNYLSSSNPNALFRCETCEYEVIRTDTITKTWSNFAWKDIPTKSGDPIYLEADLSVTNLETKHYVFGPIALQAPNFVAEITYPGCTSSGVINYKIAATGVLTATSAQDIPGTLAMHLYNAAKDVLDEIQILVDPLGHAAFGEFVAKTIPSCGVAGIDEHYECTCCHKLFEDSLCTREVTLADLSKNDNFMRIKQWFYNDSSSNGGLYAIAQVIRGEFKVDDNVTINNVGTSTTTTQITKIFNTASEVPSWYLSRVFEVISDSTLNGIRDKSLTSVDDSQDTVIIHFSGYNKAKACNHLLLGANVYMSDSSFNACWNYMNWETGYCSKCGYDHATLIEFDEEQRISFKSKDTWKMANCEWFMIEDSVTAGIDYRVNVAEFELTNPYNVYSIQYKPNATSNKLDTKTLSHYRNGDSYVANLTYSTGGSTSSSKTYFCVENTLSSSTNTYFSVLSEGHSTEFYNDEINFEGISEYDVDKITDTWSFCRGMYVPNKTSVCYLTVYYDYVSDFDDYLPYYVYVNDESGSDDVYIEISTEKDGVKYILYTYSNDSMNPAGKVYDDTQGGAYVVELEAYSVAANAGLFFSTELNAQGNDYITQWIYPEEELDFNMLVRVS